MSTKTSIKRIAAVAAVALTLGGFSAVSAHAVTSGAQPNLVNSATPVAGGSVETTTVSATPTTGTYQAISLVSGASDSYYTITASGVGSVSYPTLASTATTTLSASSSTVEIWSNGGGAIGAGGAWGSATSDNQITFSVTSAVAGVQTITIKGDVSGTITDTLTWGAAPVVSVANSSSIIHATSDALSLTRATAVASTVPASDKVLSFAKTDASTRVEAAISVTLKNSASAGGAAMKSQPLTASVSGSGLVDGYGAANSVSFNSAPAKSATAFTDASSGVAVFHVFSDGTAGTGTITVSYTDALGATTVISTETVTFYSTTPAKITATQNLSVATAGLTLGAADAGAGDGAISVAAVDSNGNPVSLLSYGSSSSKGFYVTSDNTACITSTIGTVVEGDGAGILDNPLGTYEINVAAAASAASGCVANVTVGYYISATSAALVSAPIKFTVGGTTIYGLTLTTDAETYNPGDKVTYTFKATDKLGNPIADGPYGIFAAPSHLVTSAIAGLSMSASLVKTPFAVAATATGSTFNDLYFVGGVATSTTYAPYYSGSVKGSVTLPATDTSLAAALLGTVVSASFAVANPGDAAAQAAVDAANEATDAANAATDAANNAMDSADAAQQAALDAGDKADAALAAVTDLATKVSAIASQIASLSALVKKIAAKVKA